MSPFSDQEKAKEYRKQYRLKNRDKINSYNRSWIDKNLDVVARYKRNWYKNHREEEINRKKKYSEQNPEKIKAHWLLQQAIKRGQVQRDKCISCGNRCVDGHHEDYSRPLEVIWLCRVCHKEHHNYADRLRSRLIVRIKALLKAKLDGHCID